MPRRRKSFTSRKRSHSAPAAMRVSSSRTGKRKQWTEENMLAALKAVEEGVCVSKAARDFDVPRSTLYDRVRGRVVHGVKPGPEPYLSQTEEKELGGYVKHCAKIGYRKTRRDVLCIVESAASERGKLRSTHVSDGWWRRFKERQGDLSLSLKKAPPRARLLTSTTALEMLQEKEKKKKQEAELKERRSRGESQRQVERESATTTNTSSKGNHDTSTSSTRRSSKPPPHKKARVAHEAIDDSQCCVCFTTYEDDVLNKTGKDWVGCACASRGVYGGLCVG